MKVLVFTALYPNNVWPNHGIFIKERMTALARRNECELRVVAPVPYYPFDIGWRSGYARVAKEETIDGIRVYHPRYLLIPKIGMTLHGALMCLSVLRAVRRVRRSFSFDLIDAHFVYPDGFAAVLLGRLLRKPVIVTARGSDINVFASFPLIGWLINYTLCKAHHLIAVSGALGKAIAAMGVPRQKISLIPNGVDQQKFKKIGKAEARQTLGLPEDRAIVLSVGSLNPVKGFDLLIRAFKILVETSATRKPYLVVIGDGPLRKDLARMIGELSLQSHARLVAAVPHSELYRWYSAADVFCLASDREGYPNVLLEALACGTPVVATAVGGIPEIVTSDALGFLAERREQCMADKLHQALGKAWDSKLIMSSAKNYSWQAAAEKMTRVFESVLNGAVDRPLPESQPESSRKALKS